MKAEFKNPLHEKPCIAAAGVIQAFKDTCPAELVEERLWVIFRLAIAGGLSEGGKPVSAEEVAALFDQLMALTRAVEALPKSGSVASLFHSEGGQAHV